MVSQEPPPESVPGSFLDRHHRPLVVLFIVAALVQSVALYVPGSHGPSTGLPLDKLAHFLLFCVVAALGVWAGVPIRWVVAGLVAQTLLSESAQAFLIPERTGDIDDALADILGIAVGLAIATRWPGRPSMAQDQPAT